MLRYLAGTDPGDVASNDCNDDSPCVLGYGTIWHMAGLTSALNSMSDDLKLRLLKLAVWDANKLLSMSEDGASVGPIRLMYAVYASLPSPPSGLALDPLTPDEVAELDEGIIPEGLVPIVASAKTALGLTSRP